MTLYFKYKITNQSHKFKINHQNCSAYDFGKKTRKITIRSKAKQNL